MRLEQQVFRWAVIGAGIAVALTFYFGQQNTTRHMPDAVSETTGYIDSVYRTRSSTTAETVMHNSQEASATISIDTDPPGAQVVIESDSVGRSPIEEYETRPGVVFLHLDRPDYVPLDTILIVEENAQAHASFVLRPTGENRPRSQTSSSGEDALAVSSSQPDEDTAESPTQESTDPDPESAAPAPDPPETGGLEAIATPPEATVWFDGELLGTTPLTISDLEPGSYRISFEKAGHEAYHTTVDVESGSTETVEVTLTPVTGTLSVLVKPWGSIYIDGELHKADTDVQYTTELPVGEHQLTLEHPSLGIWEGSVEVGAGDVRETVIDLTEVPTQPPE